jgi:hypothetical protein
MTMGILLGLTAALLYGGSDFGGGVASRRFGPLRVTVHLGKGLFDGLAAGLAFGILFVGLAQAGRNAGLWPVACEQTGTLVITLAVAAKSRQPLRIPLRAVGVPVLAGASGMAATLAYFYATRFSMLAIAAVLAPCTRASPSCWPVRCCTSGSPPPSAPAWACAPWPWPPSP